DFVQHCDGRAATLFGQIRFNSEVPLDLESALPAPFAFVDAVDVARSVPVMSNSVTISGITNAPISVRGGEYSIDAAPFTSADGTIANGQTLALRVMSSSLAGTPTFATVRIGAASATFQAITALGAQGTNVLYFHSQPGDFIGQVRFNSNVPIYTDPVLPAPFAFVDAVDVPRSAPITSDAVQISGISSAPISVQGGEYSINSAPFTTAPGTIANGQIVRLRLLSSSLAGTPTFGTVRIGAASATFQATTAIALQGTNVFYYHSQPGDFIGDGERGALHAGTGWTLTPRRNYH